MRCLALLLSTFGLTIAIQCPNGFSDPQCTGSCYRFKVNDQTVNKTRSAARTWCAESNATLPIIKNSQQGYSVYINTPVGYAWIGLTCPTSDPFSCFWDDGTPLRDGDYRTFASGHPNPSIGTCVFMDVYNNRSTTRQWFSTSCATTALSVCENENGIQYSLCPDGSRYFNGNCYFGMLAYSVSDGTNKCKMAGGNLASIHSNSENYIVFSVGKQWKSAQSTPLGLTLSNGFYSWVDGTTFDYRNIGFENKAYGNCVEMALIDKVIERGQWVNSQCDLTTSVNMICQTPLQRIGKIPVTTTAAKCYSTIFLNRIGTVVSPGFPNSDANNCQYQISADAGQLATISFSQISLDSNSKIRLFNSIFDETPFATITATKNDSKVYTASGNSLTMMFSTNGGNGNNFRGIFNQTLPSCQKYVNRGSGIFTSPNYPNRSQYSEYRLLSFKNRIALTFNKFSTYNSEDGMFIYDGSGTLLTLISGHRDNYTISSFTNSMRLVFKASHGHSGFIAEFISIL